MRGEDRSVKSSKTPIRGSPPHARGRRATAPAMWRRTRITPACAGKTTSPALTLAAGRDHPRMRGEDAIATMSGILVSGSPPHARGRPFGRRVAASADGITPACAGKTRALRRDAASEEDHPRMRGEDDCPASRTPRPIGSPPHARGRQLGCPGNPTKSSSSLPVFLHSQPSPLKRFLRRVLGL